MEKNLSISGFQYKLPQFKVNVSIRQLMQDAGNIGIVFGWFWACYLLVLPDSS